MIICASKTIIDDPLCFIIMWDVLFCSADTGEDVDLELLVDDFITFYIAGEQNFICTAF